MRYSLVGQACSNREQEKPAEQEEVCLRAAPGEPYQANYQKWRFKEVEYAKAGKQKTDGFGIQMKWYAQYVQCRETLDTVARQLIAFEKQKEG